MQKALSVYIKSARTYNEIIGICILQSASAEPGSRSKRIQVVTIPLTSRVNAIHEQKESSIGRIHYVGCYCLHRHPTLVCCLYHLATRAETVMCIIQWYG